WDAQRGSPLLYHSRDLAREVQARLGDDWKVELAMRYGNPPLAAGLAAMRAANVDRVIVLPLYPQYASSSTGSTLEEVFRIAGADWNVQPIEVVPAFFDDAGFLDAFAEIARPVIDALGADHVLFSFPG